MYCIGTGGSKWDAISSDNGLIDAINLKAARLGGAFSLPKHEGLMQKVQKNHVAIELLPLRDHVLGLAGDLTNHPGTVFFSRRFPVVISSDTPGLWGAKGISYDMYLAFMALASYKSDLRTLKQLVWNSFAYSAMDQEGAEYKRVTGKWMKDWKNSMRRFSSADCPNVPCHD